jgi:hypothetical protein
MVNSPVMLLGVDIEVITAAAEVFDIAKPIFFLFLFNLFI